MGERTERFWNRLEESRVAGHLGAAALVASYPLLMATALWPNVTAFAAVAVVSYLAEALAYRLATALSAALAQIHFGVTLRFGLRELALLLLLIQPRSQFFVTFTLGFDLLL